MDARISVGSGIELRNVSGGRIEISTKDGRVLIPGRGEEVTHIIEAIMTINEMMARDESRLERFRRRIEVAKRKEEGGSDGRRHDDSG